MTTPTPQQQQPPSKQQQPRPKIMVQNISCVIPESQSLGGLFVGNTYGAQNPDILKQYGIRAVLTTSIQTPVNYDPVAIPFHLKIQAHDNTTYSILPHLQECLQWIHLHRKYTNVFVHCYAGVSRSVTIVVAYIMRYWRWGVQEALAFVQAKRVCAKPNEGFIQQLRHFENIETNNNNNNNKEEMRYVPQPKRPQIGGFLSPRANSSVDHFRKYQDQQQQPVPAYSYINGPSKPTSTSKYTNNSNNNMQQFSATTTSTTGWNNNTNTNSGININNNTNSNLYLNGNGNAPVTKRHSQTPIPKIVHQLKQGNSRIDYRQPYTHTHTQQQQHSSSVNHNNNNNARYFNTSNNTNTNTNAQFAYTHNNVGNSIQNVKSAKSLIRPKDLPGYK